MYKNIVVGFDGSEFSRAALLEAANRVKKFGGKLTLVHAVYFDEEEFGNAPEQIEKRLEVGKKLCLQSKEEVGSQFKIQADSLVCQGEPPDTVVSIAGEKGADLIALGTHGRKGLKRLMMGSVTAKVILESPCDVLVVKKQCTMCTGSYRSILNPFDGSDSSKKALERACGLAKNDGADITALYVMPRYEEMIGFFKTGSIRKSMRDEAEKIIATAKEIAAGRGVSVQTEVAEGHAAEVIVKTASKIGSDLILIGSHGWKGVDKLIMGSTTERVIMYSPIPVLAVR